jgi:hypothetical protein
VLVNDVEELVSLELDQVKAQLEKASQAVEDAETSKIRLEATIDLKKAAARLEAVTYLN